LHVIRTLSSRVEFEDVAAGGTEVSMQFAAAGLRPLDAQPEALDGPRAFAGREGLPAEVALAIAPVSLAKTVLPRVISALAARAHFSTDRIADAQMLADALVAHTDGILDGGRLSMCLETEPRNLLVQVAPLTVGRALALIGDSRLDGLGSVIEKLADGHEVTHGGDHETLILSLTDRRPR
jgi:hypothetical protein